MSDGIWLEFEGKEEPPNLAPRLLWAAAAVIFIGGVIGAIVVPSSDTKSVAEISPAAALARASDAVTNAPSATFKLEMHVTAEGQSFDLTMDGVQEPAAHRSSITEQIPTPTGSITLNLVQEGQTLFLAVPAERRSKSRGKAWLSLDASSLQPQGLSDTDPLANLQLLKAPNSDVKKIGRETIDGVETVHYRATIAGQEVLNRIPSLKAMAGNTQLPNIPLDVWVDDGGHPRLVQERFSASGATVAVNLSFSNFGNAPQIAVPAASEALPVASLEKALPILVGR